MTRLLGLFLGICSIIVVSAVTASGITIVGIGGIAKGTRDAIKQAMDKDASMDQMHSIAKSNGFVLTVK